MQPGTEERIEYYRRLAEEGKPLFEDAPAGIPILPVKRNVYPRKPKPEQETEVNIDQAIDLLTSDTAESQLEERIAAAELELEKLRKMRRIYQTAPSRVCKIKFDEALEAKICKAVERGPKTPKEIAQSTGIAYSTVGKLVNASKKLVKKGTAVALVK